MNARRVATALALPLALVPFSGCGHDASLPNGPETVQTGFAGRNGGESIART